MTNRIDGRAVSAGTMDRFLATPLLEKHLAPFCAVKIPKELVARLKYTESSQIADALDAAHRDTEELYGIRTLSILSRTFNVKVETKKRELYSKIATCFGVIHALDNGPWFMCDLISGGWYLRALRVYFYIKPEALHNRERDRHIEKNILHAAVSTTYAPISVEFVSFILSLDRAHHLGLSRERDSWESTALELGRKSGRLEGEGALWNQVEQMLIQHEADLVADPDAPPEEVDAEPARVEAAEPSCFYSFCHSVYAALAGLLHWVAQAVSGIFVGNI